MQTKQTLIIAAALLAGSIATASAADMAVKARPAPPPPAYSWTGWYGGFNFSGAWIDSTHFGTGLVAPIVIAPQHDQAMVGLHAGHLHQFGSFGWGSFVIGIDQSASMPVDNSTGVAACPNPAFNCSTRFASLFTTGGVLGLAFDRFLISARGGWAGALVNTRTFVAATGGLFDQTYKWHNGWYVGGGLDYAVYKTAGTSLILGIEYQHIDLGSAVHFAGPFELVVPGVTRTVDVTADVIKAKLTVKLDGPPLLPW